MAFDWDFSKLPEHEHNYVLDRFSSSDAGALMVIHNKYELSEVLYCCTVHNQSVINWFKHGIENGYIRETTTER